MKHHMKRNTRLWLMLATLVVTALLVAFWTTRYMPATHPFEPRPPFYDRIRGDIELFYTIKTVLSTINTMLLIFLLIMYIGIYKKTQSEFTIGLIIFSLVLLLYALSSNPLIHWTFGFQAFGLGPFAMLPDLFTCAALVLLLYLTIKY